MRLLADTNVFLEGLLNQQKAEEVKSLLLLTGEHEFFMTDFSLHSIGVALVRFGRHDVLTQFLVDVVVSGSVGVIALPHAGLDAVVKASSRFGLDFDDAYQYVAAETHDLALVSFDSDFDRTERGRTTPAAVLAEFGAQDE